jgi:hypothetical protein
VVQFERPISDLLREFPGPIPWDPVPPWLREILDHDVLQALAVAHFEFQKQLLTVQAELAGRQAEILQGGVRK